MGIRLNIDCIQNSNEKNETHEILVLNEKPDLLVLNETPDPQVHSDLLDLKEILVHNDHKVYKVYSDLLELTELMVQTEKIEYHSLLSEHTHQVLLMCLMMLYLI